MQISRRPRALRPAPLAGTVNAAPSSQPRAAPKIVAGLLAADPIPALSIAVTRRDELLWAEAFGTADLELGVAAIPAHRFRLGSVSKVITATLAAKLSAEGAVDL